MEIKSYEELMVLIREHREQELYNYFISKYEGEVKVYEIMIKREGLSMIDDFIKDKNVKMLKKELRNIRYKLTRYKNLKSKLA